MTWTDAKNRRRCHLIDLDIDGTITDDQVVELISLQDQMLAHRKKVAPLPIKEVRALYRALCNRFREPSER